MSSEILQPNKPFKYASRNPRTHYKRLKSGEIFLLEVEIAEDVWNQVRTLPENALMENISWHHDGDTPASQTETDGTEDKPKKEKAEKGVYGQYWFAMHRPDQHGASFTTFPDLQEALSVDADHVHDALKLKLDVKSLTFVSPRTFEAFVTEQGLSEGLISLSKRCELWAVEHAKDI